MTVVDSVKRDRWARLRFSIIGPLLAAPPGPGQLHGALQHLAAKTWRNPVSGLDIAFSFPTLERWYYAAKAAGDPVAVLKDSLRGDIGRFPSMKPVVMDALTTQYREHQGWTAQLHYDNLCAALEPDGVALPS